MQQSIKVGIYGWTEFCTSDAFYPPDMPEEWKLSYFSNEFDSACLSLESLSSEEGLLLEWCQDLRDSFELSFSVTHIDQLSVLTKLQQQASVSLRYLVIEPSNSDILLPIKSQQSVLSAAGIDSSEQIISSAELWKPDLSSHPGSAIALFPSSGSLRQYRAWIEDWLHSLEADKQHQDLTLWFPGSATGYSLLSDCRVLVEMMDH